MYWFVYIAECADGSLYTGATNDLDKRIATHNAGKGARYTRSRLPIVVRFSKRLRNKSNALSLEQKIKQLTREEKLDLLAHPSRAQRMQRRR